MSTPAFLQHTQQNNVTSIQIIHGNVTVQMKTLLVLIHVVRAFACIREVLASIPSVCSIFLVF